MPSRDLIERFQKKNNVQLDGNSIKLFIESTLTKNADNKVRESKIREYIQTMYPQIASEFERNKVHASILNTGDPSKTTPFEFFEEYVNIISEITKEASDSLVEQSEKDAEKVKQELEAAKAAYEKFQNEKVTKDAEKNEETEKNVEEANPDNDMAQNNEAVEDAEKNEKNVEDAKPANEKPKKNEAEENAKIALEIALDKQKRLVHIGAYQSSMDYFGISEQRAKTMLEEQVNRYTYMDVRRSQMSAVGVASPVFMNELSQSFPNNVTYQAASAEQKQKMQEAYATKQLMQDKLDSKKGIVGWLWRITHRTQTKAMRNYIKTANEALATAGFDEAAEREAMSAMSINGYSHGEYQAAADTIKEKFAENEKVYAPIRAQRAQFKEVSKMPFKDQLFQIKFRPIVDRDAYSNQIKAFKDVTQYVKQCGDSIPASVMSVFKANSKKLAIVQKALNTNSVDHADKEFEAVENRLMEKVPYDSYKPMNFEEVKAIAEQKQQISVNLAAPNENKDLSKPIEKEQELKKEPIVKSN